VAQLPRELWVPHPWRFKARLDGALGSLSCWVAALSCWVAALPTARGGTEGFEIPSNPNLRKGNSLVLC